MNKFNKSKKTKFIGIRNFRDDLYRLVKAYASLEGRTISSIFEEAILMWIKSRGDPEEIRIWAELDEAYESNMKTIMQSISTNEDRKGYAAACESRFLGIFNSYEEAARAIKKECKTHALILELPIRDRKVIELGLPC
ncbi:MAG: hypothetical protein QXQ57_07895 [Sulfolobales archaeon]